MKDIIGAPLTVGDLVATDVIHYRSSRLRVGKIVQAEEGRSGRTFLKVQYELNGRKQSVMREPAGVVKVAGPEVPQ